MTQSSDESIATDRVAPTDAGETPTRTDRDLQRSALRDLVELATHCIATEAQIESRYQTELTAADQELTRTNQALKDKLETLRQQVQTKHDERIEEARNRFDFDYRAMKESDQSTRSRITSTFESTEQAIRQKLEQAVWLAESMFEATQVQVRKDSGKAEEQYKATVQQLAEMDSQALGLLRLYRLKIPSAANSGTPAVAESANKSPAPEEAEAALNTHREAITSQLKQLQRLQIPRLFVGVRPYLIGSAVLIAAGITAQLIAGPSIASLADLRTLEPKWKAIGYALGGSAAGLVILGFVLRYIATAHVRGVCLPLQQSLSGARRAAKVCFHNAQRIEDGKYSHAMRKRDAEVKALKNEAAPQLTNAAIARDTALRQADADKTRLTARLESRRAKETADLSQWLEQAVADLQQRFEHDSAEAQQRRDARVAAANNEHDQTRAELEKRWHDGLSHIQTINAPHHGQGNGSSSRAAAPAPRDWNDPAWQTWTPPTHFNSIVPFGQLKVDIKQIAQSVPGETSSRLELPDSFSLPAMLAFPRQSSLLIQADRAGRESALRTLQMVMTRLLTSQPAGRVRFTIIDPIGLGQNFAGFMHLADHVESLVGGRIWTSPEHIEQRLADLTEHMETVIQKYLRNEFETIDDYNAQAGELAEPYRFLVIADFPISFSSDAIQRLNSIASTGARCGVYTLIARDLRAPLPANTHIDEVVTHSVNLVQLRDQFIWKDEVFEQFPLTLDSPPAEESLTDILNVVGHHAKDANRVEVPFDTIAPTAGQFWSGDCTHELRVPIGRMGATRSQLLKLGRGVAQHALIAGKTGSGKSTLLHALVTNLSMWYHPDQVEFYLVDFKKGVEFKTYAEHVLPHARAIAVESDREFGLSVLQRLDAELTRRGEMFRKLGVQDLAAYRETSGKKMPRTLLIIDEFQEFFSEDDKLAQDAALLLDRLVRQGRAFGVHVLLGSQTIGGSSGLSRSTIGQMAVRIALQTSEADSQLILGDNNSAARLLTRPGEAIYNDQGGLVEGNSPFQVAWLPDDRREEYLHQVQARALGEHVEAPAPIVFEGNAAADINKNRKLMSLVDAKDWPMAGSAPPVGWLGEPVAIKDPTAISYRRQSGTNVLIVGQNDEQAMAIMLSSLLSLAVQHSPASAKFYVFDGTPADSALAGRFAAALAALPHESHLVEWRGTEEKINELAEELKRRQDARGDGNPPAVYAFIYGLQRYRSLRKQEESFSFGSDDTEKKPAADKQFADLLREGPALGIHIVAWADAPAAVERTLDRTALREFDHRVLFQMSANDSSNLIDSPLANKLGMHRALAFSEEQGVIEKFRPYALPGKSWLEHLKASLSARI